MNLLLHYSTTNLKIFNFFTIDSFQNDDNFLVVLLLMGALFFAVAVVVGIVLCLLFVGILILLLGAGLVSTSILIGLHQKSLSQGFKTFFIAGSILASTIASVILFYFGHIILKWPSAEFVLLVGVICGGLSGWLLGLLLFEAFKRGTAFLKKKYNATKEKLLT